MKTFILVLTIAVIASYTGMSLASDFKVQTGIDYDWWNDTKDNGASQVYIPLRIEAQHQQLSLSVLTGYASTQVNPSGKDSRSMDHFLDTKVNTSYEFTGYLPVDLLIGLDFNLPTGKTGLTQEDLVLIMDPDLISINNFGEGYDINPTLTVTKGFGKWVGGIGLGYAWRGEYDYSEAIKGFNPGDIFNSSAQISYYFSSYINTRIFGNFARYGADKVESKDFYQEGDLLLLGLGFHYTRTKWDGDFTIRTIYRDKSKFQDGAGLIATEVNKGHGDEYAGDISLRYLLDDRITLKSSLQGRWISKNDYPPDSPLFIGRREKFSLRLGASRIFRPELEGEVMVKGFIMHDGETQFPEFRSERDYRGGAIEVVLTRRF